jgi:hypothetical protein
MIFDSIVVYALLSKAEADYLLFVAYLSCVRDIMEIHQKRFFVGMLVMQ